MSRPYRPQMFSTLSLLCTRSGATPRTRSSLYSVTRGSPRAGRISLRSDVMAVHSKVRIGARRSDGSPDQEEHSYSRGSELAIAIYSREGATSRRLSQRMAVVSDSCAYCISCHFHVNVSIRMTLGRSRGQSWSLAQGMKEL